MVSSIGRDSACSASWARAGNAPARPPSSKRADIAQLSFIRSSLQQVECHDETALFGAARLSSVVMNARSRHDCRALELRLAASRLRSPAFQREPTSSTSTLPATEVPDELPRSIVRLFWLFARGRRATVLLMMLFSLSLRALSVLQFYAMKRIVDTAVRADLHAPGAWGVVRRRCFNSSRSSALFIVLEWGVWYCSYSSRIPVLARARQLVFTYAQRHSPTYFDNMLTGKVAHRAMLLPEQTVTLFERTNWDYLPLAAQCGLLLVLFFRAQPTFAAILAAWLVIYEAVTAAFGRRIAATARCTARPRRS